MQSPAISCAIMKSEAISCYLENLNNKMKSQNVQCKDHTKSLTISCYICNFKQSPGISCTFFMQSQAKSKQNLSLYLAIQAISTNLEHSLATLENLKQFYVISCNLLQSHKIFYNLLHSSAISCSLKQFLAITYNLM